VTATPRTTACSTTTQFCAHGRGVHRIASHAAGTGTGPGRRPAPRQALLQQLLSERRYYLVERPRFVQIQGSHLRNAEV
jgi:hypothetical protein